MHGLGNDFVVIDATKTRFQLTVSQIQKMADRRLGVGFDQLLVIEAPKNNFTDFHFRIFNSDGGEVGQCGNGACCIARFIHIHALSVQEKLCISTINGIIKLETQLDDRILVEIGIPHFEPRKIPFIASNLANFYDVKVGNQIVQLSVVNIGNPHAIILVKQIDVQEVATLGVRLSVHKCFPEGVNIGFMQFIDSKNIRLRVYERVAGETLACGSGACAAVVVGRRCGFLQKRVIVSQPGGSLTIEWQGPLTPVTMIGSASVVFSGEWMDY